MKQEAIKTGTAGLFGRVSRRNLLKGTGVTALTGAMASGCNEQTPGTTSTPRIPIPTYESIGLRPFINAYGTYTIMSGSIMLPEVRMAMFEASLRYIPLDELMEAVGKRLAELTGAESGAIFCGAAATLCACTCACTVGTDLELMTLLPDTSALKKNEVIVPSNHRNTYDRAIWMTGVKMIEVNTKEEMEAAVNEKTALITSMGSAFGRGITEEDLIAIGKKHGIPTMVDAAAEEPNAPNPYIAKGFDLVVYSGGKALRGPQSSGLLLGRKDLVKAAYMNSAPHHSYARPMKVGKEEIMALLTAVDLWINGRDHDAEWTEMVRKMDYIAEKVKTVASVETEVRKSRDGRADKTPSLAISWDPNTVKLTPIDVQKELIGGEPRIGMARSGRGMRVTAWMLEDGEEIVIAERMCEILSAGV